MISPMRFHWILFESYPSILPIDWAVGGNSSSVNMLVVP